MSQILELAGKYLKITVNNMFKTIEEKLDKIIRWRDREFQHNLNLLWKTKQIF